MLTPVPLLIIPFALYNIIVFLTPGTEWGAILGQVDLPSGISWRIRLDEAFIAFTLLFLLFEILKAARVNSRSFMDHTLSTLIFLIALAEFLFIPQAGTSIFALLLCVMLLDVISGITASMRAAPRREPRPRAPKPKRAAPVQKKVPEAEQPKPAEQASPSPSLAPEAAKAKYAPPVAVAPSEPAPPAPAPAATLDSADNSAAAKMSDVDSTHTNAHASANPQDDAQVGEDTTPETKAAIADATVSSTDKLPAETQNVTAKA